MHNTQYTMHNTLCIRDYLFVAKKRQ